MQVKFIDSIASVSQALWNSVAGVDYPFTRHEFLHALEVTGAADKQSGWQPHHALVYSNDSTEEDQQLLAVMPLYLKYHSYGEYVFDWSWADAYHRHGVNYYPKLLSAIPYTPATGPRLCTQDVSHTQQIMEYVVEAMYQQARTQQASSIHILFSRHDDCQRLEKYGLHPRRSVQYHWFNQDFQDFDAFLATFNSRKRKNLKKERRRVKDQGLQIEVLEGKDISAQTWRTFYDFYQLTYAKRSGHGGYLSLDFFELIAQTLSDHIVLVLAYYQGQPVAGALNFRDKNTLYGRYWGCIKEFDYLHFEACYYQGIEYCIANKLQRFDPGAQGEHKIQRGFKPIETWSNHWVAHPGFSEAIDDFLRRDNQAMETYLLEARELLPFRDG
jgi:uncharacterized protein